MAWLLTWLWQGLALVAAVSLAVRLTRRGDAGTRYVIWCASLMTVLWLGWALASGDSDLRPVSPPQGGTMAGASPVLVNLPRLPDAALLALGGVWGLAATLGLLRLGAACHGLWRLRRSCRPLARAREDRLVLWRRERDRGRRARLVVSDALSSPAVLGLVRPCVALPRDLVERVDDRDLDHVVLHELAHVRRWDDWARLLQSLIEAVAAFHPAVWWAGRALDLEREIACDDWVVERSGAPRAYARCLSRVAAFQVGRGRAAHLPALVGRRGALVRRVDRLLAAGPPRRRSAPWVTADGAVAIAVLALLAVQLRELPSFVGERAAALARAVPPGSPRGLAAAPGLELTTPPAEAASVVPAVVRLAAMPAPPIGRLVAMPAPLVVARAPFTPADTAPAAAAPIAATPIASTGRVVTVTPPLLDRQAPSDSGDGLRWADAGRVGVEIGAVLRDAGVATGASVTSAARSVGRWFR